MLIRHGREQKREGLAESSYRGLRRCGDSAGPISFEMEERVKASRTKPSEEKTLHQRKQAAGNRGLGGFEEQQSY